MAQHDHPLAGPLRLPHRLFQPGELCIRQGAVPALRVLGAGRLQSGEPLLRDLAARIALRRSVGADVVAVQNDETVAAAGEIVIGLRHSGSANDRGEVVLGDAVVVVAQNKEAVMLQLVVERQDMGVALPVAIDDVAQRRDEL